MLIDFLIEDENNEFKVSLYIHLQEKNKTTSFPIDDCQKCDSEHFKRVYTPAELWCTVNLPLKDGEYPLVYAVKEQDIDLVSFYLQHGAYTYFRQIDIGDDETLGLTLYSTYQSNGEILKLLLQHGADLNEEAISGKNITDFLDKADTTVFVTLLEYMQRCPQDTEFMKDIKEKAFTHCLEKGVESLLQYFPVQMVHYTQHKNPCLSLPYGKAVIQALEDSRLIINGFNHTQLFLHILELPHPQLMMGGFVEHSLPVLSRYLCFHEEYHGFLVDFSKIKMSIPDHFTEDEIGIYLLDLEEHIFLLKVERLLHEDTKEPVTVFSLYNSGQGLDHHLHGVDTFITVKRYIVPEYKSIQEMNQLRRLDTINAIYEHMDKYPSAQYKSDTLEYPQAMGNCYVRVLQTYLTQEMSEEQSLEFNQFVIRVIKGSFYDGAVNLDKFITRLGRRGAEKLEPIIELRECFKSAVERADRLLNELDEVEEFPTEGTVIDESGEDA